MSVITCYGLEKKSKYLPIRNTVYVSKKKVFKTGIKIPDNVSVRRVCPLWRCPI